MATVKPRQFIKGQIKLETLLGFAFGVIFISAILFFAVTIINPTTLQINVFKTVLALAGAGVAAIIPGQFELKHLPFIRAGGAIAVFALIFLTPLQVVSSVAQFEEPTVDPKPVTDTFLAALDAGQYEKTWVLLDPDGPNSYGVSRAQWFELAQNVVRPLGKAIQRTVTSRGGAKNPAGMPPGIYKHVVYLTKFQNVSGCRQETIVVRATNNLAWRVFTYQVLLTEIPCIGQPVGDAGARP